MLADEVGGGSAAVGCDEYRRELLGLRSEILQRLTALIGREEQSGPAGDEHPPRTGAAAPSNPACARLSGEYSHTKRKVTVDDQPSSDGQREKIKGPLWQMIDYACSSRRRRSTKRIMAADVRAAQDRDRRSTSKALTP